MVKIRKDLTGKIFGRLKAIEARKKAEDEYYGEFSYDNSQKTQFILLPVKEKNDL